MDHLQAMKRVGAVGQDRIPVIEASAAAGATAEEPCELPDWLRIHGHVAHASCDDREASAAAHRWQRGISGCFEVIDVVPGGAEIDSDAIGISVTMQSTDLSGMFRKAECSRRG